MDASLPQDLAEAHALIARLTASLAEKQAALSHRDEEIERLERILEKYLRRQYGKSSEKLLPEQMALGLEDLETGIAAAKAKTESHDATLRAPRDRRHGVKRGDLPDHLPRVDIVIEPETKTCPCCGGALHVIGEDRSERLDVIPAQHRVLVTRRPKYGCRSCREGVVQALAPPHIIEGGLPTEAMLAHVLVSKYADHLPLYRQHRILERHGIKIDRSCLADWVGRSAFALKPIVARMLELLKRSSKLFCDETAVPVLDPGRGKTKTGYLWAIARDDRPWGGPDPPGVVYVYAPGRAGAYARQALRGFNGVLQVDGYSGYNALTDQRRLEEPLDLALCWAHWRRDFFDINKGGAASIATEALKRIAALYQVEAKIRGRSAEERRAVRQARTAPLVGDLFHWLGQKLTLLPQRGRMAEIIRYGLKRRNGLTRFLDDGTIEIDSNTVERAIRPVTLNRKNALFAGHDEGAAAWGLIASLIETCKLNGVEPQRYLTDVLTKIAQNWPMSALDKLLPWTHVA